jgi:putative membrane protein
MNMFLAGLLALAAGLAVPTAARAQAHGPAGSPTPDVRTTESAPSDATVRFVRQAAIGDLFEVQAGEIALERARDAKVKAFARMMVDDHTRLSTQLKQTLQQPNRGVPVPARLDPPHEQKLAELRKAAPADFDRLYLAMQVQAHEEALALHRGYAADGDQPELRSLAETAKSIVEEHLRRVRELAGNG